MIVTDMAGLREALSAFTEDCVVALRFDGRTLVAEVALVQDDRPVPGSEVTAP